MLRRPLQCVPFHYCIYNSTYVALVLATSACLTIKRARLLCASQSLSRSFLKANW